MANNNNNGNVPTNISWDDTDQVKTKSNSPVYRGSTQVQEQSVMQSDTFSFGNKMGKHAPPPRVGNMEQSLDIRFTSVHAANDMQQKQQTPMIQIVADSNADAGDALVPPKYDGFQPQCAHRSLSKTPLEMKQTLQTLLNALVDSARIDFHEKSCFVFQGRAYSSYNDCEFLVSIFGDDTAKSIIELRRSSGETFTFANIEGNILSMLKANGSIVCVDHPESPSSTSDSEQSFVYGFESLPALPFSLGSLATATSDDDDDDDKDNACQQLDSSEALHIVQDAVALDTMRELLRSNIAYLNEQMMENGHAFKNIPNIISTLIRTIIDNLFYDCWAIKTYLTIVSRLIVLEAAVPFDLRQCVERIQAKWSETVVNDITGDVRFEFYPSQQIVKQCRSIIEQL
eukprot:CAMPEP_0202685722 /NCGR_PEP_ID=MMETSP1385-20130828/1555_1 /ASSEMBLY_ACC=CAM_ASM_000861 /TAXON_ID=933848 /ORGANISM="Elphidium margaritaceum" /LENGTH=399 /DNA_ID=CAMNT_0049340149 /DNA_START=117 /DNA_END=1316 /DNA_ORIENTATION=-